MDVTHELGALRFVVDSPLSSKVAMFNQQVDQHKQSQLLNPFSQTDGRASPKPSFSKDEYGKPLAGSLTEMRGQKANIHVLKEMLELCQIIDSEGYNVKDEPSMRVIPFGELFNIYNYISDKVVGILLRARKHKIVAFEGEMLFQRRDDDVPIFLLKPIHDIRREMEDKIESIKRCGSQSPQATSVLLDKKGHGLNVPRGATPRSSVSRTPSPQTSKAATPVREIDVKPATPEPAVKPAKEDPVATKHEVLENKSTECHKPDTGDIQIVKAALTEEIAKLTEEKVKTNSAQIEVVTQQQDVPTIQEAETTADVTSTAIRTEIKADDNSNEIDTNQDLPTIIIEASAVYERPANTEVLTETRKDASITADVKVNATVE